MKTNISYNDALLRTPSGSTKPKQSGDGTKQEHRGQDCMRVAALTLGKMFVSSSVSKFSSKNSLIGIPSGKKVDSYSETSRSYSAGDNQNSHELIKNILKRCNDERSGLGLSLPS
ncbi:hypothetical protein Ancab_029649 [Ancistrocladus abbreviatus]